MDGREAMGMSGGSSQYFIHKGGLGGVSVSGTDAGMLNAPPGFRPSIAPHLQVHPSARSTLGGPPFGAETSHGNYGQGINMGVSSGGTPGELVKKKRGRPRKYGPDGKMPLGLLPMSTAISTLSPGSDTPSQKRVRGRPPGSGRKQRLAAVGEWMNSSAGMAFAPHVINIGAREDVAAKILSFSQQRPRALCILSGNGTVSSVSLRQTGSSASTVTYEGRFEILCLSGSYLLSEDGGPRDRTGGVSVSLSSPDGHVIGGNVGMLIAAGPVQVVVCSFVYGGSKSKNKQVAVYKGDDSKLQEDDKSAILNNAHAQAYTSTPMNAWPGSRPTEMKNLHQDIDLTRG